MPFLYNAITGNLDLVNVTTGTPVDTIGTIDSGSPSSDGASISSNELILQSASATVPGLVNNTTQTFSGNKTFTGTISASNLSGTNTGNVSIGTANGLSIVGQALSMAVATSSVTGALSSTDWSDFDQKIDSTEKGAALGVATLDGGGKIPTSQLPSTVMELQGFWNASTNTPTLTDGVGNPGDVWEVDTAGTQNLGSGAITFTVGDWAVYAADNKWHKSINSNAVTSVNSFTGTVSLDTDDIPEGSNLYYTDERAQDAIGTIITDTASIDFTYNDGIPSITASVIPGGVDHNSLLNFDANKHIDHTAVSISTGVDSGLSGGGTIASTRSLVVDITGTTAETVIANNDEVLIWDSSAAARRKITRSNFLSGIALSSPGDIAETTFSASNNQLVAADVTGLAFSNAIVRSFQALVSVTIDATSNFYEQFILTGIQKDSSWNLVVESIGDTSGITFSITSLGQIQYQSTNVSGFVSNSIKFRAITTSI